MFPVSFPQRENWDITKIRNNVLFFPCKYNMNRTVENKNTRTDYDLVKVTIKLYTLGHASFRIQT